MCLIVVKPEHATFEHEDRLQAFAGNNDGFGLMYADGGEVHIKRTTGTLNDIEELWDSYGDASLVAHWRLATHGSRRLENCHPFPVLANEHGEITLAVAHNGIFGNAPRRATTDTEWFIDTRLRPLLSVNPEYIYNAAFQEFLGEMIGWNKLVFLDSEGEVIIINEEQGDVLGGCWLSSRYASDYQEAMVYDRPFVGAVGATLRHAFPPLPIQNPSVHVNGGATSAGSASKPVVVDPNALPASLERHMEMGHQLSEGMLIGLTEKQLERLTWLHPRKVAAYLNRQSS